MMLEQVSQALGFRQPTHAISKAASFNSSSIDLQKFERALCIIDFGVVTTGTCDAKWQESADDSAYTDLAGWTNMTITQVAVGNKTVLMEISAPKLSAGKRYVRVAFTLAGGPAMLMSVVILGADAVQKPGSAQNHADIAEIKVVT